MTVSVIIPTLNEEDYVGRLLTDLSTQILKADQVIVVDAQSTDSTKKVVSKFPFVSFVPSNPPVGNQRQKGGDFAKGELMIYLDADTRIRSDFIKNTVDFFEKNRVDVACPIYIPFPITIIHFVIFSFFDVMFFLLQYFRPSGAGACIIVTKELWKRAGGFNEGFLFDDMEFLYRAGKCGRFRIVPFLVGVSTRRIKKMGILPFLFLYTKLSFYFATGQLKKTNKITYPFGIFGKTN